MIDKIRRAALLLFVATGLISCTANSERDTASLKASAVNTELGIHYLRENNSVQAMDKLTKALRQDPKNPDAHNAIALLYVRLGEVQDAEEHFSKAVELEPDNSSFHVSYGAFLCQRNQLAEADKHFLRALENPLYARYEIAYTNAGNCAMRGGDHKKAEEYFRGALKANSKFPPALYQMAKLNVMKKNYMSGRAYLQRYAELGKPSARILWLSIQIEKELGDKNAVSSMTMLLKNRYPDSDEVKELHEMEKNERSSGK